MNEAEKLRKSHSGPSGRIALPGDYGKKLPVNIKKGEIKTDAQPKKEKPRRSVAYDSLVARGYKSWALFERRSMQRDLLYTTLGEDEYDIVMLQGVNEDGTYMDGRRRDQKILVMILPILPNNEDQGGKA